MTPTKPKTPPVSQSHHRFVSDDDEYEKYVPIGVDGLLAASEKVLAVSRGVTEPDKRDSLPNDRIYRADRLMAERVKLDHGKTLRSAMWRMARAKNLSVLSPGAFSNYTEGYLTGNPLANALEEINPMHITEQKLRITKMGPGGIGDPNAVTSDMQSVSSTQFGFVDPLAGPECLDEKSEVFTLRGWVPWSEVTDDEVFACKVEGRLEWHKAERIIRERYTGEMILAESTTFRMCVTPNHRVVFKRDPATREESVDRADVCYGKSIHIPLRHAPMLGDESMVTFTLPEVEKTNSNQKAFQPFAIEDWCAFVGWWLAEGSSCTTLRFSSGGSSYTHKTLQISQCITANPENHEIIRNLLRRMGLIGASTNGGASAFAFGDKQLTSYFSQWSDGCYDKRIPEDLQHAPVKAREALLDALIRGDGRDNSHLNYCTVSHRLALSVERLAVGLGYAAYIRIEPDKRPHGTTTNYIVVLGRSAYRTAQSRRYTTRHNGTHHGDNWSKLDYDGMVYCAAVPGGQLHVRGKLGTGFWTGNSSSAGIDVRLATGARLGSDGRIYQIMLNRRTGKRQWVSPVDLVGKTLKLPD